MYNVLALDLIRIREKVKHLNHTLDRDTQVLELEELLSNEVKVSNTRAMQVNGKLFE